MVNAYPSRDCVSRQDDVFGGRSDISRGDRQESVKEQQKCVFVAQFLKVEQNIQDFDGSAPCVLYSNLCVSLVTAFR